MNLQLEMYLSIFNINFFGLFLSSKNTDCRYIGIHVDLGFINNTNLKDISYIFAC